MVRDSVSEEQAEQLHGRQGTLLRIINKLRDVSKSVPGLATPQMGLAWIIPIDSCGLLNANCPHSMKCGQ